MTARLPTETGLPPIPNKRYFTIGEVGTLCDVKSHVLRYWEQEFSQLKPTKRRGNRRYYQRHDIELIRLIRALLYDQGFTIAGARQQLSQGQKTMLRVESGTTKTVRPWAQALADENAPTDSSGLLPDAQEDAFTERTDDANDGSGGVPPSAAHPNAAFERDEPAHRGPLQSAGDIRRALEAILLDLEQHI